MSAPIRSHPINILERTSRYLVLLLLPLLRTLWEMFQSFYFDEIFSWLVSVRWTLAVIAFILGAAWYEWYRLTFVDDKEGLRVTRGVFFRSETQFRFDSVTLVSVVRPWYYRPFQVVRLGIDTDAGGVSKTDFEITVSRKYAWQLIDSFREANVSNLQPPTFYAPNLLTITFFAVLTSNLVSGAFYSALAISQLGKLLGRDVGRWLLEHFTKLLSTIQWGLPPIISFFFWLAIALWLYSFLRNLERTSRFTVMRRENLLTITSGVFTRHRNLVYMPKVNALILQQNLICRPFGIYSAALSCTGYGLKSGTSNVLLPSGKKTAIKRDWATLFPEFEMEPRQIAPKPGCKRYFYTLPIVLFVLLSVVFAGLIWWLKPFRFTLFGFWVLTEIPVLWYFLARVVALKRAGVAKTKHGYVFRYLKGFRLMTACVPKERVAQIFTYSTSFQNKRQCCHLLVTLYGEQFTGIIVPCLDNQEVQELFGLSSF